ncbi:STE/STE20/KHS protein kinase [Fonticula alba]|uniref:non-specific serine/threonine protein kinase n=1 Tax=Fonticula alba TaxID=691883 RepID=A0A058ZFK8_FONAL|nr:STE/STE20/KHS protein kinase [Fonticula alba]KCV72713.1 STE/STE20/KHS protein kinase [Fonticula alba]|eukprot:XP_009492414.1 STE/STE20/KHS protein kinase [Fonticula alba]
MFSSQQEQPKDEHLFNRDPTPYFKLLERVGKGSFGHVRKARVLANNSLAAIKIVDLEPGEDIRPVLHEVNIMCQCTHNNIVRYLGSFLFNPSAPTDQLWIIMEFCAGGSLEAIYRASKKPFTEPQIRHIMHDAISGLEYLHSLGKMHRDLKGGNLLITDSGVVKLADFGVSAKLTNTLSKRQSVIGSPYWMAPEVIQADENTSPYDEKADIWSIGVTAIELSQCGPPLFDLHPMRALFLIPKNKAPTLTEASKWSSDFNSFIQATVNKNPKKRQSAAELLRHPFLTGLDEERPLMRAMVNEHFLASGKKRTTATDSAAAASPGHVRKDVAKTLRTRPVSTALPSATDGDDNGGAGDAASRGSKREPPSSEDMTRLIASMRNAGFSSEDSVEALRRNNFDLNSAIFDLLERGVATKPLRAGPQRSVSTRSSVRPPLNLAECSTRYVMERICTLRKDIFLCGDVWESQKILFLGSDVGLVCLDFSATREKRTTFLSERPYRQLFVLNDLQIMISLSGKSRSVCIYDLADLTPDNIHSFPSQIGNKSGFEAHTRVTKFLGWRGVDHIAIERQGSQIFLIARRGRTITICRWAPAPYSRFMLEKTISSFGPEYKKISSQGHPSNIVSGDRRDRIALLLDSATQRGEPIVFSPHRDQFILGQSDKEAHRLISFPPPEQTLAAPVPIPAPQAIAALGFEDCALLCFETFAIRVDHHGIPLDHPPIIFQNPIVDAIKVALDAFLVINRDCTVTLFYLEKGLSILTFNNTNEKNKIAPICRRGPQALLIRYIGTSAQDKTSSGNISIYALNDNSYTVPQPPPVLTTPQSPSS